ncbi:MAG: hypothetical protein E7642_08645 [Ruminococcaceae bacterium]|nr:hypothetical protein [Oscillospiraceae bacterium]
MKKFFHDYSYNIVKMFVNQFAISIFGVSLTLATTQAHIESSGFDTFTLIVSILAVIFYLYLIYTLAWEIGAKDKISVDVGKKNYRPHLGILLSLFANIPNILAAIIYAIATILGSEPMLFVVRLIATLLQGMYFGIITAVSIPIGDAYIQLNSLWPTFFIMVLPAMLTSWLAYFLGHKNFRIFSFLSRKTLEENSNKAKLK